MFMIIYVDLMNRSFIDDIHVDPKDSFASLRKTTKLQIHSGPKFQGSSPSAPSFTKNQVWTGR